MAHKWNKQQLKERALVSFAEYPNQFTNRIFTRAELRKLGNMGILRRRYVLVSTYDNIFKVKIGQMLRTYWSLSVTGNSRSTQEAKS